MSKKLKSAALPVFMVIAVLAGANVVAQQAASVAANDSPVTSTSADNTRLNQRDKSPDTIKPTDQPNNTQDIKLVAAVRRAIVGDSTLSTSAHNVKVVTMAGAVMLRGPVASQAEKVKVGQLASAVPGVAEVTNELDVKQ